MYKNGISYNVMDKIISVLRNDINMTCKNMESVVVDALNIDFFWHLSTICPVCNTIQRGHDVFCSTCLKSETKTRTPRLKGCRGDCFANPTYCDKHINDENIEDKMLRCYHDKTRVRGINSFDSFTPVSQLIDLMNSGMVRYINNSTESEIIEHIKNCKDNDSTSPLAGHNNMYGFAQLGKVDIAQEFCNLYKDFKDVKDNSEDSFPKLVNNLLDENSIERELYFRGMIIVIDYTIR